MSKAQTKTAKKRGGVRLLKRTTQLTQKTICTRCRGAGRGGRCTFEKHLGQKGDKTRHRETQNQIEKKVKMASIA